MQADEDISEATQSETHRLPRNKDLRNLVKARRTHYLDICWDGSEAEIGFQMRFTCRSDVNTTCLSGSDFSSCGDHGACVDNNGFFKCVCADGWRGGDCKTPPPFQARLGTASSSSDISAAEAFPAQTFIDISVSATSTTSTDALLNDDTPSPASGGVIAGIVSAVIVAACLLVAVYYRHALTTACSKLKQNRELADLEMTEEAHAAAIP